MSPFRFLFVKEWKQFVSNPFMPAVLVLLPALLMLFRGAWLREKGWIPGGKAFARCLLCGFGIFFLGILTENWLNPAILHAFWKIYR